MLYFVINPGASRTGYGWFVWKQLEKELKRRGEIYQYYVTKRPKEAVLYAKRLTAGTRKRRIIVLGGDGTLNEFLNGMERTKGIELGYIPVGSGNDFARGMKISKCYKKEFVRLLDHPRRMSLDYGIVTAPSGREKRFFVSAGMGYDARVCYKANHTRIKKVLNRMRMGKLVYLVVGLKYLIGAEVFHGSLEVDGRKVLEGEGFFFASVHILPYEGGGFCFCPNADPEDGYLDICVAKGISKWKIPFIIPLALMGRHTKCKGVYQFRCKEAVMRSESGQYVHTDGETRGQERKVKIDISKEKIMFIRG